MRFEDLSYEELLNIAEWGLTGAYESSGCRDDVDTLDEAKECAVEDFRQFINTPWPEGLGNIPSQATVYRFISLKPEEELNEADLGTSWYSNPQQHNERGFWDMLTHIAPGKVKLRGDTLYRLTAQISSDSINVPTTLWERSTQFWENEIALKDGTMPQLNKVETYDEINRMNEIIAIIRQSLLERFGFNNDKSFSPPENVKSVVRRAIAAGGQTANGGNEGSGARKAQELADGGMQTHAQMKRLKAFFDANQPGSPEWELHGGNAAKMWVNRALSGTHDDNMRTKEQMRRVGGGGYGMNDGMGNMSATMMKTNNTRNHSVWTRAKNAAQNK